MKKEPCIYRQPVTLSRFCLRYQAWRCARINELVVQEGLSPRDARCQIAGEELSRPWLTHQAAKPLNDFDKACTPATCSCLK